MKKLTENLIQQRLKTCTTDLEKVIKINITGADLEDVSLLQKMTGIEILSFSVNNITSLADFRFCKNLKELYLRNNKISDLEQISYLKDLPKLKLLMLSENPCTQDPLYRMTVIKNLKNLTVLDGIPIKAEERRQAQKLGRNIFSENEDITNLELNNKTSNHDFAKLYNTEKSLVEVKDHREQGETGGIKESKKIWESIETKEPKRTTDLKELKEINLVNEKFTTENDECDMLENLEQTLYLSSASDNEKCEREPYTATRIKSMTEICKYCGKKKRPKFRKNSTEYNLLIATIKLVKELDYSSLKIVNDEINSRFDTYEMDLAKQL